jgi:hypothetical protein
MDKFPYEKMTWLTQATGGAVSAGANTTKGEEFGSRVRISSTPPY